MYYPDAVIEEVRTRSPIVDVVGSYVHLTKKGGNYFGLCPFHNEKTPSFSVSASKQMFHCFGCGKGGNVVTFIMEYENATFPEAIELLADRAGITLPKREFNPNEKKEADLRTRLLEIQKEAALFYCRVLRTPEGKTGLDYFRRRGISEEMIRSFGLGFSPMRADSLYRYLKQKGYRDDELKESGLIRFNKNGGYDYFFNRVIFPIMDVQNRVIGFGGRVMGTAEPKYLNSPETRLFDKSRNLYGLHAAKRSREKYMIVSEGYIDIIALHQAGFTNAVASLGTAFTPQHAMILKRYVQEVILCYDSDGAGKKAAMRAIPILREVGMRIRVMSLSPYKDPDEFLKNLKPEDFKARIDEAENAFLWEVSTIRDEFDFSDPDDKTEFIRSAAKMLSAFTDEIERNAYTEAVAKRFGLDYGTLKTRVSELGNRKGLLNEPIESRPEKPYRTEKKQGRKEAEKLILTSLSETPEMYRSIIGILHPEDFSEGTIRKVATILFDRIERGESASPAAVLDHFTESEDAAEAAGVFSSTFAEELGEAEAHEAITEAVRRVKLSSVEDRISKITDPGALMNLLKEKQELLKNPITL